MPNEIVLVLNLIGVYFLVLLSYVLFDIKGMLCWTVIATIAANIEVLILIEAFGMSQTLGNVMFASTFLATDIISEIAGKKEATKTVNIGIFASMCFMLLSQTWLLYTPSPEDWAFPYMQSIFSQMPRLMVTGLIVYAIVQRFDVWLYHMLWELTEKKFKSRRSFLWLRNTISTLCSQFLNTLLFTIGAFWGVFDTKTLISIIGSSYIVFIVTSLADTPIVYLARRVHESRTAS